MDEKTKRVHKKAGLEEKEIKRLKFISFMMHRRIDQLNGDDVI